MRTPPAILWAVDACAPQVESATMTMLSSAMAISDRRPATAVLALRSIGRWSTTRPAPSIMPSFRPGLRCLSGQRAGVGAFLVGRAARHDRRRSSGSLLVLQRRTARAGRPPRGTLAAVRRPRHGSRLQADLLQHLRGPVAAIPQVRIPGHEMGRRGHRRFAALHLVRQEL